jgi:putative oxidoreductase
MNTLNQAFLPLLARLLLSVIFVTSALSKIFSWSGNVEYMSSKHLPMIPVLLAFAVVVEALGPLCLITGFGARIAAAAMFCYMIPVTFLLHDFMSVNFQKNLGIMGGLLMLTAFGPGRFSLTTAIAALRQAKSAKLADAS